MNIKWMVLAISLLMSSSAFAGDRDVINRCLANWKNHPFGKNPVFRTMSAHVKVMGSGTDLIDRQQTSKPTLILVKSNVSVMSSSTLSLLNPNGWYCLKHRVAILGSTHINLNCRAHATSMDGGLVLGEDDNNGVTVAGSAEVRRVGCSRIAKR